MKSINDEVRDLAEILFRENREIYEQTLWNELIDAGDNSPLIELTNSDVLKQLANEAIQSAEWILQTYAKDLESLLAHGDVTPSQLREWGKLREEWKSDQIAKTEASRTVGEAQREFIRRTRIEGQAWFGDSLVCPICQEVAAKCPLLLTNDLVGQSFHPGELDFWTIVYESKPKNLWYGS